MPDGFSYQDALTPDDSPEGFSFENALTPMPSRTGRAIRAGIQGYREAFDAADQPFTPETQEKLDAAQRAGGVKGYLAGLASTAGEDILAPFAAGAGLYRGAQAAAIEAGVPKDVASIFDAELGSPGMFRGPREPAPPGAAARGRVESTVGREPPTESPSPPTTPPAPEGGSSPTTPRLGYDRGIEGEVIPPEAGEQVSATRAPGPAIEGDRGEERLPPPSPAGPEAAPQQALASPEATSELPIPAPEGQHALPAPSPGPESIQAHGGPWLPKGTNGSGEQVFENPNGARAIMEDGNIPLSEPTVETEKGLEPKKKGKRKPRFEIEKKPEEPTPEQPETPQESAKTQDFTLRVTSHAGNSHKMDILGPTGKVGEASVYYDPDGKDIQVDNIGLSDAFKPHRQENTLGPAAIISLKKQLIDLFPDAEKITGIRVSGANARHGETPGRDIDVSIKRPPPEWTSVGKNADGQEVFTNPHGVHSIVSNGMREVEPVRMRPTRGGMETSVPSPEDKDPRFKVVPEAPVDSTPEVAKPSHWLNDTQDSERQRVYTQMRAVDKEMDRHYNSPSQGGQGISVGAQGFDGVLAAEVRREFLKALRGGQTPEEAANTVKELNHESVRKHNEQRPKDINWKRSPNSYDNIADLMVVKFKHLPDATADSTPLETSPDQGAKPEAPAEPPKAEETTEQSDGYDVTDASGKVIGAAVPHPRQEGMWMAMWKATDPRDAGMKRYKTRRGAIAKVHEVEKARAIAETAKEVARMREKKRATLEKEYMDGGMSKGEASIKALFELDKEAAKTKESP